MNWYIDDEEQLRQHANIMLGLIGEEEYEAIIQEILLMDRGSNPNVVTESKPVESKPVESKPVQKETPKETQKEAPQQTQPEVQSTQSETQPQVQETESNNDSVISIEEADKIWEEAGLGGAPQGEVVKEIHGDSDAGQGYDWGN